MGSCPVAAVTANTTALIAQARRSVPSVSRTSLKAAIAMITITAGAMP